MKKTDLIIIKRLVKEIMSTDTKARNSDSYLYLKVLDVVSVRKNFDLSNIHVKDYLLNMAEWGFPCFESVRRARQKLQREFPELSGNIKVQEARKERETVYREFARSVNNG